MGYLVGYVVVPWEIGSVRGCEKVMAVPVVATRNGDDEERELRGYQEKTGGFDVVVVAVVTTCGKRLGKVWIQEERQPSTHLSGYRA